MIIQPASDPEGQNVRRFEWYDGLGQDRVHCKTYLDDRYDTTSNCIRLEEWKFQKLYSSNVI